MNHWSNLTRAFACLTMVVLWFGVSGPSFSQHINVEPIIAQESIACPDIAFTLTHLLPLSHRDNQPDTIYAMLNHWQYHCGGPEPMVRFRILYQIETNTFSDYWYPDNILTLLDDYKDLSSQRHPYYYDYFWGDYIPIHPSFNDFTMNLATYLQRFADLKPIESFFLEFYSHQFDQANKRLSSGELAGTRIDSLFRERQQQLLLGKKTAIGLYVGAWMPRSGLSILGNHLQIGIVAQRTKNRIATNLYMNLGLLNAPNDYAVVVNNVLYTTRSFLGIQAGVDLGYEIIKTKRMALLPLVGVAIEGFEAFSVSDQETFGLSKFIGSLNLNAGAEYRIKTIENAHIGIQGRYHLVNYQNEGGSDLSGNVVTFGLILGFAY